MTHHVVKKARRSLQEWLDSRDEHHTEMQHYQQRFHQMLVELEGVSRVAGSRIPVEIAENIIMFTLGNVLNPLMV
ncbi:hypothetical protein V2A60_001524 [Cordyceps javanica]